MPDRRFPPPWIVEEHPAWYIVQDRNGFALAYVYYEEEPGRRTAAKLRRGAFLSALQSCPICCASRAGKENDDAKF